jgi:hypothetical protein
MNFLMLCLLTSLSAMSRVVCRTAFRGRHGRRDLAPSLGLERLKATFLDNLIDMDFVRELNERSRKPRFGARRAKSRPGSDRPKKTPTAHRVGA